MKLIILQGPPASGKSTWVKEYMAIDNHMFTTMVVSRDAIRHGFGEYNMEHEAEVTIIEETNTRDALAQGLDVINDATNLNPKYLPKWEAIAKEYGAEIEYKKFYVPFKVAVERDKNADRPHHVGEKVIKRFYKSYYPEEYEKELMKSVNHYRLPMDMSLPTAVMCDLDGTVAWMQGRSPYSTTDVDKDAVDPQLAYLLGMLMSFGIEVIFLSGRMGNEECRSKTYNWIKSHVPNCTTKKLDNEKDNFILLMRRDKDFRGDEVVKKEIFENEIKNKYNVVAVFDDRNKVVNMWRETGLLCCQVADGDF
ncbi:MAG: polynucleotide kinase [Wendovervirus sonii]|uniref:Polynucleotide kinase n=1 Tax=phage Lak_Megaphage_Sonny TaxID=3109229 RepID=A0ABZ0Z4V7_9CAUD|nr:MAG: polynucleotide kinase [phage Lak_Megaphage_Sonny]